MRTKELIRFILAVISGAVSASITLLAVGAVANAIQPTPPELMDPATPEAVARRVSSAPLSTWISTLCGLALGAFLGGALGAAMAREKTIWVTSAIGLALSPWAFYTFYIVYPEVLWVPAGMLISVLLFSYLGGVVAARLAR